MDRPTAVELVRGLVAIPSLSQHESAAATWLVEQMRAAGYERAFVDEVGNAVGELGDPSARRTIILLGHIDTVPGNIPVRIDASPGGDLLFGRGSVDAKGALATFVAGGALFGAAKARAAGLRVVVVGAVEEEAATSRGARFIASRFDGTSEDAPEACVIGEPSHWHRLTLGYKGRLLLNLVADQPMAHTAGPDASVAAVVVDFWNWITSHAAEMNTGRAKAFDQESPSLRRFVTSAAAEMRDRVDAEIAWRLPPEFDIEAFVGELLTWSATYLRVQDGPLAISRSMTLAAVGGEAVSLHGARTSFEFRFRGWEIAWRADRDNALVRSFLSAIRAQDPAIRPGFVFKTGTSDMNVVAPIWRCPIVAYGPGDSALDHTPNEHLPLDEYWRAILVVHRALDAFASQT